MGARTQTLHPSIKIKPLKTSPADDLIDRVQYPLALEALKDAKAIVESNGSSIEGPAEEAIFALLNTLEDGLHGRLPNSFFLSSIDPGIGKTLSVSCLLKAWKGSGFTPAVGVLIAVSRLDEISTYAQQAALAPEDFAVLTRSEQHNALGSASQGAAAILFTTQQMIGKRAKSGRVLSEFFYKGEPRALRIWDESMVPEEALTVRIDDLGQLASPLRHKAPEFVQGVQDFQAALWALEDGGEITVPEDITTKAPKAGIPDRLAPIIEGLAQIAGKTVQAADVGHGDMFLLGASTPLPDDFTPAVILDASGRVRPTYALWDEHRGNLIRLPAAVNDYKDLAVRLWQRGSGKVSMGRSGVQSEIAGAIAAAITAQDDDNAEWLIVSYKDHSGIVEDLRATLPNPQRLKGITWGRHAGTNAFADIRNVVLVGQMTYRPIDYKALACAASGLSVAAVEDRVDLEAVRWGEFQHHLLQALCRASVRRSRNGIAGACRAWVIATPSVQTEQRLRDTFPGCRLNEWDPRPPAVPQRVQDAIAYIQAQVAAGASDVRKKDLRKHLVIENVSNFKRDILDDASFVEALRDVGMRQGHHGFVRQAAFEPHGGA